MDSQLLLLRRGPSTSSLWVALCPPWLACDVQVSHVLEVTPRYHVDSDHCTGFPRNWTGLGILMSLIQLAESTMVLFEILIAILQSHSQSRLLVIRCPSWHNDWCNAVWLPWPSFPCFSAIIRQMLQHNSKGTPTISFLVDFGSLDGCPMKVCLSKDKFPYWIILPPITIAIIWTYQGLLPRQQLCQM